jgi:NADPH:quinone reductase
MTTIPTTMRAAVLHDYQGAASITIEQRPTPQPKAGELLVKIIASPINPSDQMFIIGGYAFRKPLPTVPGFEASGTVVAVGDGVDADEWLGKRVACFAGDGDGTWAEYMATSVHACIPLLDAVSDEQAAMLLVNPLTAWGMMDIARERGLKAVVQTAAAGALGKMVIRLGQRWDIETINVVRREAQVDALRRIGAAHVLNSSTPTFKADLRGLCASLGAKLAFDAVGGVMTGDVLNAMPRGSSVMVYGGLSLEACAIQLGDLIFREKGVEGFYLSHWMRTGRMGAALTDVYAMLDDFGSAVRARYPLDEVCNALNDYAGDMSGGKVLITP